jgi:hypothetical protein
VEADPVGDGRERHDSMLFAERVSAG